MPTFEIEVEEALLALVADRIGQHHPSLIQIRTQRETAQSEGTSNPANPLLEDQYQRYCDLLPSYEDPRLPNYSANQLLPHWYVGEGPLIHGDDHQKERGYHNMGRFCDAMFNVINFKHVVAIGPTRGLVDAPPQSERCEKKYFSEYFTYPKTFTHNGTHYQISPGQLRYPTPWRSNFPLSFQSYQLHIIRQRPGSGLRDNTTVKITHIPDWQDGKPFAFDEPLIEKLLALHADGDMKFMHCSAGRGRAGTLVTAFAFYDAYDSLSAKSTIAAKQLFDIFTHLNQIRPATIQTTEQLKCSWLLAQGMKRFSHTKRVRKVSGPEPAKASGVGSTLFSTNQRLAALNAEHLRSDVLPRARL
jgi:Protein-tyrosine phosphatase